MFKINDLFMKIYWLRQALDFFQLNKTTAQSDNKGDYTVLDQLFKFDCCKKFFL